MVEELDRRGGCGLMTQTGMQSYLRSVVVQSREVGEKEDFAFPRTQTFLPRDEQTRQDQTGFDDHVRRVR